MKSEFEYGADLARYKQVKGTETTIYIGKEVDITLKGNTTTTKTYIDDIAIVSKTETAGKMLPDHKIRFTHRDRLGSVVTLTDHNNHIMEHRSYDPFGKPRSGDFMDVAPPTLRAVVGGEPFTNRGFTDHEHLDDAQLIHMNGRAYDYNLGRFLSVDPFIQFTGNSQSINPYSYIMNNPLAGTDPSGYLVAESFNCDVYNCGGILSGMGANKLDKSNGMEKVVTVTGTKQQVSEKAEELMSEGYKAEMGRSNADGTFTQTYVKPSSGGTEDIQERRERIGFDKLAYDVAMGDTNNEHFVLPEGANEQDAVDLGVIRMFSIVNNEKSKHSSEEYFIDVYYGEYDPGAIFGLFSLGYDTYSVSKIYGVMGQSLQYDHNSFGFGHGKGHDFDGKPQHIARIFYKKAEDDYSIAFSAYNSTPSSASKAIKYQERRISRSGLKYRIIIDSNQKISTFQSNGEHTLYQDF